MIGAVEAVRVLAGDAMIAAGHAIRGGLPNAADWPAGDTAPSMPRGEVRSALHDLPDSRLIGIAAAVIAGWAPILLVSNPETNVDLLIDALRDRRDQFAAAE